MVSTMSFHDLDRENGTSAPTSYESIRAGVLNEHPIPDGLPETISARLVVAVDVVALAYEQAKLERWPLFGPFTDSAVTSALLVFELVLKHRLQHPPDARLTFGPVIQQGKDAGVLPRSTEHDLLWDELIANRNDLIHGNPGAPLYGVTAARVVGIMIDTITGMLEVPGPDGVATDETRADNTA